MFAYFINQNLRIMKIFKFPLVIILILFLGYGARIDAQTYQQDFEFTISDWEFTCPELTPNTFSISGVVVYHFTYHVNPKTGEVDRIHNNVKHADIYDTNTGETYCYMDTGNDNIGTWWPEWLGIYPEQPAEGTTVASTGIKIVGNGVIFTMRYLIKFQMNANGQVVVDSREDWIECNF